LSRYNIGVISDTHGLIREEALDVLKGSDLIIHAGDVGNAEVIEELKKLAPVYCVRGNCDKGELRDMLPENQVVEIGEVFIYVVHNVDDLNLDPEAAGISIVITGHSHKPCISAKGKVLYLNPGSAGPRRFNLPIAIARLTIEDENIEGNIIELSI
jgi:putative phosphoesterase